MSRRGLLGIGIVLAWGVGLAAFARRELTQTEAERLAESALRVAPGATHFAVLREGRHVGYASTTIDTLPARIQITDYLVADVPVGGGGGDSLRRETHRTRVRLTRRLALRDFLVQMTTDSVPKLVRGRVLNDTVLEYVVRSVAGPRGRTLDSARRVLHERVIVAPLLPLVTMLEGTARVGRSAGFAAFDPVSGEARHAHLRLAAESLFVVSDSAVYDGRAGKWRSVHNDTVRAWRVEGVPGTAWIDALGRAVRHERPDGYTLQRTAYELAFENWRAASRVQRPKSRGQRPEGDDD